MGNTHNNDLPLYLGTIPRRACGKYSFGIRLACVSFMQVPNVPVSQTLGWTT